MGTIYLLKNTVNGKGYVGQTTQTLVVRWNNHRRTAKRGRYPISMAIRKYGPDAWTLEILQECSTPDETNEAEIAWIAGLGTHVSTGDGYNASAGGRGGYKHDDLALCKVSAANKGVPKSAAHRAAISAAKKGRRLTDEHRAAIRAGMKSESAKAKMSASQRLRRTAARAARRVVT